MRITLFLLVLTLTACKLNSSGGNYASDRKKIENELGSETSLAEDRSSLAELRKEVPQDTQKSNDELALFLNLMKQGRENPQGVREKFQSLVHKRRTSFRDKVTGLRNDYRKDETKRRDDFMASQKSKRDAFIKRKRPSQETREFFSEQEKERLTFFAEERSRRMSFESELNAQTKDFDSSMRERQKEFDEQYRIYTKRFTERPKDVNAVTGDEFKRLEQTPASPLGTEE